MAGIEIPDTVLAPDVLLAHVARIRPHTDDVPLLYTRAPDHRFADIGIAYIGRVIKRTGHRVQDFLLVVCRKLIRIFFRRFAAARRTGRNGQDDDRKQAQPCRAIRHQIAPGQSRSSLRRRWPSVRKRSALSLTNPSASRWS